MSRWKQTGIYRWRIIESVVPSAIRDTGGTKTKKSEKKNEKK